MRQPSVVTKSSPFSAQPSPYAALADQIRRPVNVVLLVGILGCLSFWCAVAFGIAAAV